MLVLYFLILWVLFLGLGILGSFSNGDRDFDQGFITLGAPSALMGALVTSVATGSDFPLFITAVVAVIGVVAGAWGHYGNQPYTPPSWEEVGEVEVEVDPLEDFRVLFTKAEARIAELENDKRALLSAAQHQQRAILDLFDRVEALEARAETPKPAELLETNQQIHRALSCFDAQDPQVRAPSAHA